MANDTIPIEGYPSEYVVFLKKSALEEVRITLPTRGVAWSTRAQINLLRSKMRKEDHPLCATIDSVVLRIEGVDGHKCHTKCPAPDTPHILVGSVRGTRDTLSAFHEAGIMPETLDDDPLADFPTSDD